MFILALILSVLYFSLADTFFSESDAIEELTNMKIEIKDNFTILQNKSSHALSDYYYVFKLKLSDNDAQAVRNTIRLSANYDSTNQKYPVFFPRYTNNKLKTWVIKNYKNGQTIIRDQYFPTDTGVITSFKRVSLDRDTLTFYNVIE